MSWLAAAAAALWCGTPGWSLAAGVLEVQVVAGYNLVVDSNATSPATYAPKSAYVGANVCNTGDAALDDVVAYAGDFAGATPGVFPVTTFGADPDRPHLAGTGDYSLTLEAGGAGPGDATRYVGTLGAGECRMQYWLVSYPQCVNSGGLPDPPPCAASVTGGTGPGDDLVLDYDVWAATGSPIAEPTVAVSRTLAMRSEISASANKIWPNTDAKVPPEYLDAIQSVVGWGTLGPDGQPLTAGNQVYPGQRVITTQGIWYDLGNVGAGFDNDGDLVPDRNAWLQPIGDPASFDAGCFRLVNAYGVIVVKLRTGGELLIPFENRLYFEDIPENTGVVGLVYYQFVATAEGCSAAMTPYQESASGFDNEKFSADYGLALALASGSYGSALAFTKTDGVGTVAPGGTLTYTLAAANTGTGVNLGAPELGMPLAFRETVPAGTTYVAGSAVAGLVPPAGAGTYDLRFTDANGDLDTCTISYAFAAPPRFVVRYSTDGGATWGATEPVPASAVTDLQWLLFSTLATTGGHDGLACTSAAGTLETSLPAGASASVSFQVSVGAAPPPVVCNTGGLTYGSAAPGVTAEDCDLVTGGNSLAGTVFRDDGAGGGIFGNGMRDGGEAGLGTGIVVKLFYDRDGDGALGDADVFFGETTTGAGGAYSFGSLPDGPFLVSVQKYGYPGAGNDVDDLAAGWGNTTYDPSLPPGTDQGVLRLDEDLATVTLAVNVDLARDSGNQALAGVNFGFAPPLRVTKAVQGNPDANGDGRADAVVDEGDAVSYAIYLENRLRSVGRQGPTGCEYTVWAPTGGTGINPKDFTNAANAYDSASPNTAVATALVSGGGLRWLYGTGFNLAPQPGAITKVEALFFGWFNVPLTDDILNVTLGAGTVGVGANGLTGDLTTRTMSTALIDSYIGAPADLDPNRAIAWDVSTLKPNGTGSVADWAWGAGVNPFATVHLQVNPTKTAPADAKVFSLDALGLRVTTDSDCVASPSTTLSPVPLQDTYDPASFAFVSADPAPTSVDTATGVIRWDDVGPILPGTTRTVTVTVRALDIAGTRTGACGASPPPAAGSACNWAETAYGGRRVLYGDGRAANDDNGSVAVTVQGKGEVRGALWRDQNADGWPYDAGEPWLPRVTVTLFACVQADGVTLEASVQPKTCAAATTGNSWKAIATAVTDASGAYEFIGLDTGYYLVEVGDTDGAPATGNAAPYGGTQTAEPSDTQAVSGGNATGVNGVCAGGCNNTWGSPAANLSALNQVSAATEETINGVNFGYNVPNAIIHGEVWHDIDGDAVRDPGEGGIAPFAVALYTDADGDGLVEAGDTLVATSSVDAAGRYAFGGLAAGSYVLVAVVPTLPSHSWVETVETTGGTGSLDDRMPVTVTAGAISGSHGFGYTLADTSAIGDTVYFDFDADAWQDPAETGIPLVTVRLYRDEDRDGTVDAGVDALVASDETDADGRYLFEGLPAGSYVVVVDTADPDFPSAATATADPDTNEASIGDRVWLDANGDGVAGAGEDGIPGAVVNLYLDADASGTLGGADPLVASTVTDLLGNYLLTGLGAGAYFVDVDEASLPLPALALTTADPAATLVTLAGRTSADQVLTADAGYSLPANYALGNRVWSDADGDGVQDPGEVGMPGVTVTVTNGTGTGCSPSCVAVTDADGSWYVGGLTNGTFTVDVLNASLPRDFTLTSGTDPRTVTVAGADLTSADFGYRFNRDGNPLTEDAGDPTGTVSGRVFEDLDGDRAYDAGEALAGAAVHLVDGAGAIVATAQVAADGTYAFTGVFVGDYSVLAVDERGARASTLFLAAGEAFPNLNVIYDRAMETAADGTAAVAVDGVHANLLQDFGYQRFLGSIGDTVYQDVNENATRDFGEPGVAGVTVRLFLCGWADANADGLYESGEETGCPAPLATVVTGADDPLTAADEGGRYLFSNLDAPGPGQYYLVRVDATTLPGATQALIGDPDTDGVPCPALPDPDDPADEFAPAAVCDGAQLVPAFVEGVNYLGADFGYRITGVGHASIGDHLWIDADGDGLVDATERGVPYVSVWLDGDNDGLLDWADGNGNGAWDAGEGERWVETDADGYFVFTGLADGTYDLRVLATDADWPAGLPATPVYEARGGNATSLDNHVRLLVAAGTVTSLVDGDPATPDACTKVAPESCDLDADFGYRYAGSFRLSGTLCAETGTLDGFCGADAATHSGTGPGEQPLSGVVVSLLGWADDGDGTAWAGDGTLDADDDFTLLGGATTDGLGDFSFQNVPAGGVVLVLGLVDSQQLRLTTTNATSSVEGATTLQLFEGTAPYGGNTVTVLARQALSLPGNALDADFAFDGGLGGAIAYDFGDLPDTFVLGTPDTPDYDATLLASGGARHRIGTPTLGAAATPDVDGSDSPLADGDGADDGVVIPGDWVPGAEGGWVQATASGPGWLAGWIDFDGDGDFGEPGEMIVNGPVVAGANDVVFDLPASIEKGTMVFFARFRLWPSRPLLVMSSGLALDATLQPAAGEVEDYRWNIRVTAAVVSAFSACDAGGAVGLEWRTAAEVGTVGFLLRRLDPGAAAVEVGGGLLPSLLRSARGGSYRIVDAGANPAAVHEYELVEVEASGRRVAHGPYAVSATRPCAFPDGGYAAEAAPAPSAGPAAALAAGEDPPGSDGPLERAKVLTSAGGIHYLAAADLARALGIAPTDARRLLREGALRLDSRGRQVAILPAGDFGGAFFLAREEPSSFTRERVYRATVLPGGGLRMAVRDEDAAGRGTGTETFTRVVRAEQDRFPAHAAFTDARLDHWLWEYFVAGGETRGFALRADGAVAGEAALTLLLLGQSETGPAAEHHAEVRLNGTVVGDVRFDGLASVEATLPIDAALLRDGENLVEVAALADTGAPWSVFSLDSLALRYPSRYRAVDGVLSCEAGGNRVLRMSGFASADVLVFDVTRPARPVLVRAAPFPDGAGGYAVDVAPARPDERYLALERGAVVRARRVVGDRPSALRAERRGWPYLVVTTAALRPEAGRLAALRGGVVVDLEDVYDEFNAGVPSPYALKRFLRHAWTRWRRKPQHVLLAGDGSHDYRDNLGLGGNLVPPMLVGTGGGLFPSDAWFGDVAGGAAPEMAVGRLPAASAAELRAMIDKVLLREASAGEPWPGRAVALADDADAAGDFPAGSDRLAAHAPPGLAERVHLGELSLEGARAALLASVRAGTGLVSYVGHAGYDTLAAEGLLTAADVPGLDNAGAPTLLAAFSCLVGDFAVPGAPSLGELLVRAPAGGAAAVFAPTGLVRDELSMLLAEGFLAGYHGGGGLRLGDAVLRAARAYEATGNAPSTLALYELLGDPAMPLP